MNYKHEVNIYVDEATDDGFGGTVINKVLVQTIKCRVLPYRVESEIYANGKINANMAKLFTKDTIKVNEYEDFYIEFKGTMYIKKQLCDYEKVLLIVMEKVK